MKKKTFHTHAWHNNLSNPRELKNERVSIEHKQQKNEKWKKKKTAQVDSLGKLLSNEEREKIDVTKHRDSFFFLWKRFHPTRRRDPTFVSIKEPFPFRSGNHFS